MIWVEPFFASDLDRIDVQPAQLADWPDGADRIARGEIFAAQEHGRSFYDAENNVVACIGMVKSHDQHLTAWSILSPLASAHLLFLTRWCRAYLDALDVRRIDMCVRGPFAHGHQWAKLLGFTWEGVQHGFYAEGENMHVYVRLKGHDL